MGFSLNLWIFILVLTGCFVPCLRAVLLDVGGADEKVIKIYFKDRHNKESSISSGFWSVTSVRDKRISNNDYGRLYIGHEAALFRLHVPALHGAGLQTVSFQLCGHSQVFVRQRTGGEVYLERSNGSQEFNKSASFKVFQSNYLDFFNLSSVILPDYHVSINNSNALVMSLHSNQIEFQGILEDNIENLEANAGFSKRHWAVTSDFDFMSHDVESILYNPPNGTSTMTNILPYSFKTSPHTLYRVQGYWRPYFDGWYNFSVNSDLQYKIIVERDNRTIKICRSKQTCDPVFLHGGPTYAFYYVEIRLHSRNASEVVSIDVLDKNMEPVKFAEFKKVDHGRATHRWTFDDPCTTSCWDDLKLAAFTNTDEKILIANHLILNPENFKPGNDTGFSVGFWLNKSSSFHAEILSYGSYLRVSVHSRSVVFFLEKKGYHVLTLNEVFHVLFTSSGVNGPRCFINGKHTKWYNYSSVVDLPVTANELSIVTPVNIDFHLSELSLWSSEITPEQVLEEFHVSCKVYPSTCRWKNTHPSPNQWLLGRGPTTSYPFTGPGSSTDYYFYIDGSQMKYNSSAVLLSPKLVAMYPCLSFKYFMHGMGIGKLSVLIMYKSHAEVLWSLLGAQQIKDSSWKNASVNLSLSYLGPLGKIAFRAVRGDSFRSDIAISDIKFQMKKCETTPPSAISLGTDKNKKNSCPTYCPTGHPCINSTKKTGRCVCDTRQANFVNQFCLDDIASMYRKASHFWSMDETITDYNGTISLVTGVAKKAAEFKSKQSGVITNFTNSLNDFSISVWIKINAGRCLFKIPRLTVLYDSNFGLQIFIRPIAQMCSSIFQYQWPVNIFSHMVIVSKVDKPYVELYKNGILQSYDSLNSSGLCGESKITWVELFPKISYDDFAIWPWKLSKAEIDKIFGRYVQYKTVAGNYAKQPVIFNIDGRWRDGVDNATDKDVWYMKKYNRKFIIT